MPTTSIIIPIYHDNTKIETTLQVLIHFFSKEQIDGEILIVNDGGDDGGVAIVEKYLQKFPFIRLINRTVNRGKGYTVREGLSMARGKFIFFTDADLPFSTPPIKKMLQLLQSGSTGLVIANRNLISDTKHSKLSLARRLTHYIYSYFVRLFIPIPYSDTLAGLKGMSQIVFQTIVSKLTIDRWSFDVELILVAQKQGIKIQEIPVSLKNTGESNLRIRHDAPEMIHEIITIWKQYRNGYYD